MNTKPDPSTFSAEIRRQAEAKLAERKRKEAAVSAPAIDPQRLLHELQVHQIQLEMQNEELMRARAESEALLYLYTDLYDFSPVGYCVLAQDGAIQQINLTGATLLGVERSKLIQRRFGLLVSPASRPVFTAFLERVFTDGGKASCEVALQKEGNRPLWVHIEASVDEKQNCRAVMMDITERKQADEKLRESEERFRSLASSFNDVIYTLDTQQRHTGVYGDWVEKAGLTPEFFLGRTAAEIFGPEAAQIHAEPNQQALAGKSVVYEWSNGILHYQTAVSPLRNSQGQITGIVGVGRDITESKRIEMALRESEDRYHNLFENSSTIMVIVDPETTAIVDANPVACKYYGWSREEMLKKKVTEINTLTAPEFMAEMELVRTQKRAHFIFKHRLSDGTIRDVEIYTGPLVSSGRPLLFSIIHDITERRQAEDALALSEARFRSIIDVSPQPLALNNEAGQITFLNPAFIQTFGYDLTDIPTLAEWWPKAYPDPAYRQWVADAWQAELACVKETGKAFTPQEVKIRCKDGGERTVLVSAAPLVTAFDGDHLVLFYDITERKQAEEALLKFKLGIERSADAIFMTDPHGTIVYANPSFEKIYGYTLADLHGHTPRILKSGVVPAEVYKQFWAALFNKSVIAGEIINKTKDGRLITIEGSNSPILDAAGTIIGFLGGIHRDITERKIAEESLREIKERYEMALIAGNAGAWLLDRQQKSNIVDERWAAILGYTLDEVEPSTLDFWESKVHPDDLQRLYAAFERHERGEIPMIDVDVRARAKNGDWKWISDRARILKRTPDGEPWILAGIHTDITEQKRVQDELREKNAVIAAQASQFQTILDTLPEGVLLLDEGGRVLLANPVAVKYLAPLTSQEADRDHRSGAGQVFTHLGGRPLADLLTPDQGKQHEVQAGARTFAIIARPTNGAPDTRLWVLVLSDITQERQQQRYQQAQERLATVGQMAAGIAHDFNNIMGVIVLYTEMLRGAPGLSERQQRQLGTIYDQAQHAANLIRQILDFSRRSVLEKTALNILFLVKELIALLEHTLPESIHLELAYDRSEYIINGDPTRLQQALMNLAVNARDAMPSGGQLTFTCAVLSLAPDQTPPLPDMTTGEWFCLSVADTGTGITPENIVHLFDPFFTTKEPGKGSGLGLAQVYGILKQHDGHIAVQTQEGKGTTFTLYLPMLMASAPAPTLPNAGLVQGQGETILVVEDNPNMRAALVDILEVLNYRVQEAGNGREALAILEEKPGAIDLVLSDLVMPEMGGQALLQAMRERGLGMPLVVLSGHPLTNEMEAMQVQGLAGWLLKPPDMHELSALLARILGNDAA